MAVPTVARADPPAFNSELTWSDSWRRVRLWEAIDAVALTVGDTEFEDHVPLPTRAIWTKPILFDSWARNVFRGHTAAVQSFASTSTDLMYKVGAFVPFVVDDYFAAAGLHQNVDVAAQLTIIDFQSDGIAGLVSLAAEHGVGRQRPYVLSCGPNGLELDPQGHLLHACGTANDFRSFYSGHATATSVTASLVCLHHQHLALFGGGFADLAPCLVMIAVSAATGLLRLTYDEHWASDVVVGWADGFLSGYVLPSLMHFGFGNHGPIGEVRSGSLDMFPTLMARQGGTELGVVGVF
jgi:hypothetical protein